MRNKLRVLFLASIYIPFAFLYVIIWGIIGGILGNIIGTFQDWKKIVVADYNRWRFMPKAFALEWWSINNSVDKDRFSEEKERIIQEVKAGKRRGPYPLIQLLVWILYYVALLPFRIIWGIFAGPIYLTLDAKDFFMEKILKQEIKIINPSYPDSEDISFERV